jgi:hypothetical protein
MSYVPSLPTPQHSVTSNEEQYFFIRESHFSLKYDMYSLAVTEVSTSPNSSHLHLRTSIDCFQTFDNSFLLVSSVESAICQSCPNFP